MTVYQPQERTFSLAHRRRQETASSAMHNQVRDANIPQSGAFLAKEFADA
jgi:hypothetical protein